ncbi:MAG: excinuclease ABC subunit UvrC, partial [Desulfatiglandales bacterium]
MAEYPLDLGILQESLPSRPGVYLFKDEKDQVLYVGKAKDLKKRVLSYLFRQSELSERIGLMLKATKGLDILVTNTESEAFILERNLIKRWMPKFNVVLRDDKQYPLLRIPVNEPFPNISVVRRIKKDGARYFGPYTSSNAMRETLRVLYKAFSLRKCKGTIKPKSRPCLNYQMKRCLGPCTGEIREEDYRRQLDQAIQFLEGKARSLIDSLKKEMFELSEAMEFERAALLRDRIKAIQRTLEPQAIVSSEIEDSDILGIAEGPKYMHVVVLRLRDGIMQEGVPYRL